MKNGRLHSNICGEMNFVTLPDIPLLKIRRVIHSDSQRSIRLRYTMGNNSTLAIEVLLPVSWKNGRFQIKGDLDID